MATSAQAQLIMEGILEDTDSKALSRRRIFRRAAGVAAVGAAGGSLLKQFAGSPALAAGGTTIEQSALAPAVVMLADGPTINVDASLGNDFRVTISGNRTIASPANPTDGQKITFQVTQGSAGSNTVTWGSTYEFSAGLPQPTLSTAAGDTDLLGFIYNAAKANWLLVAFVPGFITQVQTSSPPVSSPPVSTSPPPAGTYRLFPSTNGPSSPVSYSGAFQAGVLFEATAGATWFDGYWWWVCPSGQSTAPQKFALWAVYNDGVGALIPAATVTSSTLTTGWNYVPLTSPIPLAQGACYNACTGFSGSFPDTNGQYGAGGAYAAGIVSGPLTAFSDASGSKPAPFAMSQSVFSVAGTDPTANMPAGGSGSDNFWMDLQITTTPPPGTSYRLWPNYPELPGAVSGETKPYTLATEVTLAQSCALNKIWFYSSSGSGVLPSRCAIWNVATKTVVAGTDTIAPSWSGAAASGWVSCAYSGVTLPAGDYKAAVFNASGSPWFQITTGYWASGGPAANGITAGPLSAPGLSAASSPGQSTYNEGSTWAYPASYGSGGDGENYWIDVEVTPS